METTIKLFNRIRKIIPVSAFYSITMNDYMEIYLQGKFNPDTNKELNKLGFHAKLDEHGYLRGERRISDYTIHIILT